MFLLFPTFVDYKQLRKAIDLPVLGTVSLQMTPDQVQSRKAKLHKFLLATSMLLVVYIGVMIFEEPGSSAVRAMISDVGIYL